MSSSESDEISVPVRIGAGSFAAIYAISGHSYVFKVVHDASQEQTLLYEFNALHTIYSQFNSTSFFALPRPLAHHNPTNGCITMFPDSLSLGRPGRRAYIHATLFTSHPLTGTASAYLMDRAHPLPTHIANIIRTKFYSQPALDAHTRAPAICRLYFGKTVVPSRFINSANFPMDIARMNALRKALDEQGMSGVIATNEEIASGMGEMLGKIHWLGGFDARDVEFVMAGSDSYIRFFIIDFNQMRLFNPDTGDISLLVDSFFVNDPYYPRPTLQDNVYLCFKTAYIDACPLHLRTRAAMFTDAIEARHSSRTSPGSGATTG
ncbi:hypothetical protein FB451DRAFT_74248 [Mycena latifolia]|nr:hypothetical protein FB451DRAFT_74248 [Mycena latifolia]